MSIPPGVKDISAQQLKLKNAREAYIRTTVVELFIYTVYLIILCIAAFGMHSSQAYYYTKAVTDVFLDASFEGGTFRTSTNVNDFWKYAENVMVKGLYWENWYSLDGNYKVLPHDQGVLNENRLVGTPRLRQLVVKEHACPIAQYFRTLARICYAPYDPGQEDRGVYNKLETEYIDAWKYHSEGKLEGFSYTGIVSRYSGAGSFVLLGPTAQLADLAIAKLKDKLWINRSTRVVFLDFTLYNANINMFCIVKLIWEFPATGGVLTSWNIRTVRLVSYVTPYDYFILTIEFIFCLFTIYYFVHEILTMVRIGCKRYIKSIWSWLALTILSTSCVCIAFCIVRYVLVRKIMNTLLRDPNRFENFESLGYWETQFNNGVALCVFFSWVKIFKYISFNKTMNQLSSTLYRCAKDIGGFSIMFFIVFFAFAQLGYLLFGSQVGSFRTFGASVFTLLRLVLGDFNFREIEAANRILGPIFFFTYVFFVFFVLLNMFLAIINDTYIEVKAEIRTHRNEFEISDYFKQAFNNLLGFCGRGNKSVDVKNAIKLSADDGRITHDELRSNLLRSNFSDVEVEMFLARYEIDQDRTLDPDETEFVLADMEGHRPNLDKRGHNKGRRTSSIVSQTKDSDTDITKEEFKDLGQRVDTMETSLNNITQKLDGIIIKLDTLDKPTDEHRGSQ